MVRADKHIEPPSCVCAPAAGENFSINPKSIQESFQVWLQGMIPPGRRLPPARVLTAAEVTSVTLATVRESVRHRRWPKEVIEKFLAAEIVTHTLASHVATGDQSMVTRRFSLLRMSGENGAPVVSTLGR